IDFLPAIERLLGDARLPAHIADGDAPLDLLQDRSDLLDGKAFSLHGTSSWPPGRIVPQNSRSMWTEIPGAPHRQQTTWEVLPAAEEPTQTPHAQRQAHR